ncbi:imidazole glycerol phosphate synthase subunit HisH [Halosquirtibacter xylanolyticus]|uniref:imidazole glycerol phosphate synthase subunit HisH n=1 Tax=Halosquirtibacter xylanolyticus TaxID=3374599 RepID=UPI00374A1B08|nr:imidazole glycerol phosphate synthase subunit HisH [Prolixibacteraceae bacterium]
MKIAIIKYNGGNIFSVQETLKRLGAETVVTDHYEQICSADRVIFPGVGQAKSAMNYLKEHQLDKIITELQQPVLGICLGLQLMCQHSEEGDIEGLGIFDAQVKKFIPQDRETKVPHMGWNQLNFSDQGDWRNQFEESYLYFVHSYYAEICQNTFASCHYANDFSAMMKRDNFWAMQFHPEKSGEIGSKMLNQFLNQTL